MSIVKVVGTGRGVSAERTLFVGPRIPPDIKAMSKQISQIGKKTFRKMLHNIVDGLTVADNQEDKDILTPEEERISSSRVQMNFQELVTDNMDEEALQTVYSGLYSLFLCVLKKTSRFFKKRSFQGRSR